MIRLFTLASLVLSAMTAQALVITQWDFNGTDSNSVPGGPNGPTPSIGTGVASLLGGVTGGFSSGISNGGSSDPVNTSPPNFGWQTTSYAAQGSENGGRGVVFMVSTAGYSDITISFDTRHSNTSSRWVRLDYTTDGGATWNPGSAATGRVYEARNGGDTWYNLRLADLTNDSAADDNPFFGFRMVAIFGPPEGPFDDNATYDVYSPARPSSSYASTGTLRWDMVTVSGEVVPEPATIAAMALGVGTLIVSRRRKR